MNKIQGTPKDDLFRLNIGGIEPRPGWKILNIQPGPNVDFIGDCTDLTQFGDESITEIYASHVLEHLSYIDELQKTIAEAYRVLAPNGIFKISVPDFEVLCRMFLHPSLDMQQRHHVMRMIFGGQLDEFDFHRVGLTWEFMSHYLHKAGFTGLRKVEEFKLFDDCSSIRIGTTLVSLNLEAVKGEPQATCNL